MRAALYARVSTEEQAREGTSLDSQREKLRAWATAGGHTITGEYVDDGYSGKDDNRPELQRLMADAKTKSLDVVVTTKLDRFLRNFRLLLDYQDRLAELGISYIAIENNVDTSTPFGKLVFNILGVVAEWERTMIADRTSEGKRKVLRSGKLNKNTLYGYDYDGNPETRKWVINQEEAAVVRRIYDMYLNQEMSMEKIAAIFNKEGIPTGGWKSKAHWAPPRIMHILKHKGYTGHATIWGDIEVDYLCIIDKAFWDRVQARILKQRRLGRREEGDQWLLQGRVLCGDCGHIYLCRTSRPRYRYYSCNGRKQKAVQPSLSRQTRWKLPSGIPSVIALPAAMP